MFSEMFGEEHFKVPHPRRTGGSSFPEHRNLTPVKNSENITHYLYMDQLQFLKLNKKETCQTEELFEFHCLNNEKGCAAKGQFLEITAVGSFINLLLTQDGVVYVRLLHFLL